MNRHKGSFKLEGWPESIPLPMNKTGTKAVMRNLRIAELRIIEEGFRTGTIRFEKKVQ